LRCLPAVLLLAASVLGAPPRPALKGSRPDSNAAYLRFQVGRVLGFCRLAGKGNETSDTSG
jgi:hypothetical protein